MFVSPVFATRSHPGARTLGRMRLRLLIAGLRVPVIALGGDGRGPRARAGRPRLGWNRRLDASEAEGGAHIDRLAVATLVGQARQAVALGLVAHARGHIEVARQRIGAADIDRIARIGADQRGRIRQRAIAGGRAAGRSRACRCS
ncbi:MAG: hypothetical protein WDN24_21210 [Sphingomonas sp.]